MTTRTITANEVTTGMTILTGTYTREGEARTATVTAVKRSSLNSGKGGKLVTITAGARQLCLDEFKHVTVLA